MAAQLTKSQAILLAVSYAAESKTHELEQLCALKTPKVLEPELILRILVTYLPAVTPPSHYITLVKAVVSGTSPTDAQDVALDISSISDTPEIVADKKLRQLTLLPLSPPAYPPEAPAELVTRFVCHRAYRIDEETGLITLIPDLVVPFLGQSEYLRTWYLAGVLPLLRLQHEYYPDAEWDESMTLQKFQTIDGYKGTEYLLSGADRSGHEITSSTEAEGTVARDLRAIIGPWLYGHTKAKRRRVEYMAAKASEKADTSAPKVDDPNVERREYSWKHVNTWLVNRAVTDFPMTTAALENWNGPPDLDLGEDEVAGEVTQFDNLDELQKRYNQVGFASCYAVEANTADAISGAHGILVRLAELMDFEPPPDLATSVDQLPKVDEHMEPIDQDQDLGVLDPSRLLEDDHPLTAPSLPSFMLLQMLVYSSYQLVGLGYNVSIRNVTKLRFFATPDEQMGLVQKILHDLVKDGKRNEHKWLADRGRLLWLWDWNIDMKEGRTKGSGVLGSIPRHDMDVEIVKAMLTTDNFALVDRLYVQGLDRGAKMSTDKLEDIIMTEAMRYYDTASNGNKNRGNMKKAAEILAAFRLSFPESDKFRQALALIAATHSMSFYSLTLQHGVPFQPVNIRAASDPISLLEQILDQNHKSYTKLDDLISIGKNLATGLPAKTSSSKQETSAQTIANAERRVIFMCISSALASNDFDTAYSYLINRLSPADSVSIPSTHGTTAETPVPSTPRQLDDDISWRAAFLAGRFRPSASRPLPTAQQIRRLEQRAELLSLALLLAPATALTDILNVYRRCEEELTALRKRIAEDDDAAATAEQDYRPTDPTSLPGMFTDLGVHDGRTYDQTRREFGRLAGGYNATAAPPTSGTNTEERSASRPRARDGDETPIGLFDLARGAAGALRRNAFPLGQAATNNTATPRQSSELSRPVAIAQPELQKDDEEEDGWGDAWGDDTPATTTGTITNTNTTKGSTLKPAADGDDETAWGWTGADDDDDSQELDEDPLHTQAGTAARSSAEQQRVRRRDVLAGAVTDGLASGIGWVLGAQPVAGTGGAQAKT